jgi:hypothetical protein
MMDLLFSILCAIIVLPFTTFIASLCSLAVLLQSLIYDLVSLFVSPSTGVYHIIKTPMLQGIVTRTILAVAFFLFTSSAAGLYIAFYPIMFLIMSAHISLYLTVKILDLDDEDDSLHYVFCEGLPDSLSEYAENFEIFPTFLNSCANLGDAELHIGEVPIEFTVSSILRWPLAFLLHYGLTTTLFFVHQVAVFPVAVTKVVYFYYTNYIRVKFKLWFEVLVFPFAVAALLFATVLVYSITMIFTLVLNVLLALIAAVVASRHGLLPALRFSLDTIRIHTCVHAGYFNYYGGERTDPALMADMRVIKPYSLEWTIFQQWLPPERNGKWEGSLLEKKQPQQISLYDLLKPHNNAIDGKYEHVPYVRYVLEGTLWGTYDIAHYITTGVQRACGGEISWLADDGF